MLSALLVSALYNKPIIRKYEETSEKLESASTCNVLVLADLHNTGHGLNNKNILDKIEKAQPDLILFAGDLIGSYSEKSSTLTLIKSISVMAPMYYVTGNHEFWTYMEDEFIDILKEYGVNVLRNESETVEIAGMTFNI